MRKKDAEALQAEHGAGDPEVWGEPEPIPRAARMDVTISVRFTAEEIAKIRGRAEAAGMKPTAYIRQAALDRDEPPVDRRALDDALAGLATGIAAIQDELQTRTRRARPAPRRSA